jgi:hypothetical protein
MTHNNSRHAHWESAPEHALQRVFQSDPEDPGPHDVPSGCHQEKDGKHDHIKAEDDLSYPPEPSSVVRQVVEQDGRDTGTHVDAEECRSSVKDVVTECSGKGRPWDRELLTSSVI